MTDEYQIITLLTQLPYFVNDAVYTIYSLLLMLLLLLDCKLEWNIAYVNLVDHCGHSGAINEEQTLKHWVLDLLIAV